MVTASFLLVSAFFGWLFMNETLDSKKDNIDLGTRFRRAVARMFKACFGICSCKRKRKLSKIHQRQNSMASEISEFSDDDEEISPNSGRRRSEEPMLLSPHRPTSRRRHSAYYRYRRRSSTFGEVLRRRDDGETQPPRPKFKDILSKQVVLNMVVYAGLALHTISFDQLFPLLCSTGIHDGGLGMTAGQVGAALSIAGVMAMVLQITIFPWGHNKFGGLFCLRFVLFMYPVLYMVYPAFRNY